MSISEIRRRCGLRAFGVQSVTQFMPEVLGGVEVRAKLTLDKPRLHGARFVHRSIALLEHCWFGPLTSSGGKL